MSLVARQELGWAGSSASADARPGGGPGAPLAGAHRRSGYRGAGMCRRPASRLALGPITPTLDAPAPACDRAHTRRGRTPHSLEESAPTRKATARGRGGGQSRAEPVYQPHLSLHKASISAGHRRDCQASAPSPTRGGAPAHSSPPQFTRSAIEGP